MNRREKRRMEKLRRQGIDAEFKRLTDEEKERRKKKLQDKALVQEQLLAELEQESAESCSKSQASKEHSSARQTDSEFARN